MRVTLPPAMARALSAGMLHFYRRPMLFLVGLVVLPLTLTVAVVYRINRALTTEQSLHNLGVTGRLAAEIVERTLAQTLQIESVLAELPELPEALSRSDGPWLIERVAGVLMQLPGVQAASVVSPEGLVLASLPHEPLNPSVAGQAWFNEVQTTGRAAISPVYLDGDRKVVAVAVPVIGEQATLLGEIQVLYGVEDVRSWLQTVRVDPDGYVYVVDNEQQLVVHPRQILPGRPKQVADWAPVSRTLSEGSARLIHREPRTGREWLAAVHPVGDLGWRVVATQPLHAALSTVHRVFAWLCLLLLFVVGLIGLVCQRWVRLHEFSLQLLRQNAKMLRQHQQRTLGRRKGTTGREGEASP